MYRPCCCVVSTKSWLNPSRPKTAPSCAPCVRLHASMDEKRELRSRWQRVAKLILAKEDVLTVSRALELALFSDAKLDVSEIPAK